MKTAAATLLALAALPLAAQTVDYRFDDVKRKVTLTTPKQALQVTKGQHAQSGDKVQTGWLSYALIASERHRAKFELFGSTDVRLAQGEPGVILSLERGRLRAMFDKITGTEPRVVKTPGALLAVRGTRYDVTVDNSGKTDVVVFEGIVEVRSDLRPEPLFIHAGEAASYGRREPPVSRPMSDHDRQRGEHDGERPQHQGERGHEPGQSGHDPRPQGQQPPDNDGRDHGHGGPPTPPPSSGQQQPPSRPPLAG
jgi:hypothetical protein